MLLSAQDKKKLEAIHKLFLEIEKSTPLNATNFSFHSSKLETLKGLIKSLGSSENPDVSRLAELERHLVIKMTLKHFVSFAVPVERLLQKSIQDKDFLVLEDDAIENRHTPLPLIFVLDNIRSAFNVGSIFRTAECLGVKKVFLCGYTPTPEQIKVEKTAMGTQGYLDWEHISRLLDCIDLLKSQDYRIIALETAAEAQQLYAPFDPIPTAFILGNERFGLGSEVLNTIDEVRVIPLRGRKNSLNVGVSAAIAGFEWMRQWSQK